jgi:GH15 family glucan-1,4-alpha-glucosidase
MYSIDGTRRLPEYTLDWLAGYENSSPVRVGNAASDQLQLDVWGEVLDGLHLSREMGLPTSGMAWSVQRKLLEFLESNWQQPDNGLWEVRGPRRQFVHSKVMAWAGFDRAIKDAERFGFEAPLDQWRPAREAVAADVWAHGFDRERNTFVRAYGEPGVDASLLLLAQVGFVEAGDPAFAGTVEAIDRELKVDGFVLRYRTDLNDDGLPPGEGAFLACSFWLADAYAQIGRTDEARALFERLLAIRNDVGLLAEEYDPRAGRFAGNFPQAFSHVGLINTASNLTRAAKPSQQRGDGETAPNP